MINAKKLQFTHIVDWRRANLQLELICTRPNGMELDNKQKLSYRQQIVRQLRTQYAEGIYRNKYYTVTLKSR